MKREWDKGNKKDIITIHNYIEKQKYKEGYEREKSIRKREKKKYSMVQQENVEDSMKN